jgi:hypothetical protein
MMRIISVLGFAILILLITACNPWRLPLLKEEARKQDDRITRETEEAIKKSSKLQELNQLCTEKIPKPTDFELLNKHRDFHEETFVGYGYRSKLDYQTVKRFYLDYFAQNGWVLAEDKNDGWGDPKIEVHKDSYRVTIYDMGAGEGKNYSIVCGKLK